MLSVVRALAMFLLAVLSRGVRRFGKVRAAWALAAFLLATAILIPVGYFTGIFTRGGEGVLGLGGPSREERIRRSVKIRTFTDTTKVVGWDDRAGKYRYNTWWWLEAPPEILNDIVEVDYKAMGYPFSITRVREDGFKSYSPWNRPPDCSDEVILRLRDGSQVTLKYPTPED
jgi:hypothetical protein